MFFAEIVSIFLFGKFIVHLPRNLFRFIHSISFEVGSLRAVVTYKRWLRFNLATISSLSKGINSKRLVIDLIRNQECEIAYPVLPSVALYNVSTIMRKLQTGGLMIYHQASITLASGEPS